MGQILLRKPWTQKPPVGAAVQTGHPLAAGLVASYVFNEGGGLAPIDSLQQQAGVMNSGVTWESQELGHGLKFDGSSGIFQTPVLPAGLVYGSPWSAAFRAKFNGTPSLLNFFELSDATNQLAFCYWWTVPNNGLLIRTANNVAGATPATNIDVTLWHSWVFTDLGNGTNPLIYIDGVLNQSANVTPLTSDTRNRFEIARGVGGSFLGTCSVSYAYLWNRVLQPSEIQRLNVHPYGIFVPRRSMAFGNTVISAAFVNWPEMPRPERVVREILSY